MNFHEYKDLAMIYSSDQNGKPDYTWDKAEIVVWNPDEQRRMQLVFTGSERPNGEHNGKINFNVVYLEDHQDVFDAFRDTLKTIFPNISDETTKEYERVFVEKIVNSKR